MYLRFHLSLAFQVAVGLSTFAIDLHQVAKAIRQSTTRSLILVDEFGKGTVSHDGLALLAASLEHLIDRGPNCPVALFATHFHELAKLPTIATAKMVSFSVRSFRQLMLVYKFVRNWCNLS